MTQPVKKTDVHVVQKKIIPGSTDPVYGHDIFSIINPSTGEEVERVQGYGAALAARDRWNGTAARSAQ